jgi:hypothetical protein
LDLLGALFLLLPISKSYFGVSYTPCQLLFVAARHSLEGRKLMYLDKKMIRLFGVDLHGFWIHDT